MFTLLLLCAVQKPREAPPADPRDLTPRFEASAGLAVSAWATGEQLRAPLAIDVDWRGRVWVLEGGDEPSLSILEDSASAGFCDRVSVFHAWKDNPPAPGLAIVGRRALLASQSGWLGVADVDGPDGPREVSPLALPWSCSPACGLACVGGPGGELWLLAPTDSAGATVARLRGSQATAVASLSARASGLTLDSFGNLFASERAAEGAPGRVLHLTRAGAVNGSAEVGDPCALASYESNFMAEFENTLLVADRTGRLLALTPLRAAGGTRFEQRPMLAARAGAAPEPFAPLDLAVGLDGSLFVLDVGPGRGARILRVASAGRRVATPRLSLTVTNGQLSSLLTPAHNVRATAFELLAAQGDSVAQQVQGVARARNPRWQARALWLLALGGEASRASVREQLSHEDPQLRATALRALANAGHDALDLARRFRGDPSSAIRAEALELLAALPWDARGPCVLELLAPWPAQDELFADALARVVGADLEAFAAALAKLDAPDLPAETRAAVLGALGRRRAAK